jgi:hypothetical protein
MTTATTPAPRATARASRTTKAEKDEKKMARVRRATASNKMETDTIAAFTDNLRALFAELPDEPKGRPSRKVKLKLADGEARITITFEVSAKTRRK